ncbi:PTS mannose transporter subunit IIABC [Corynebacterium sp. sy017]|uniref:fructose-specific PTS transporter subunit EIIC n=1 Tax=unclassified Corynebacterium TaxID=2624378 RepID=UPI001184D458|nr:MULTISPECIES: fructose-specific PTS transporter subunit EIIC [unclassified Corynebacterium]MBP3089286.1 PTS mannose transporter subunit IIABC [Corynebacterium sp. sy017]TSD91010.1 PTS mannose transporter subunit IIABC [Corynebacterium sp. SY003]
MTEKPLVLAITACPTGIAHTYMAAEKLEAAAQDAGVELKIETHGSIGVEGAFSSADIERAAAVLIAADVVIAKDRFIAKPILTVSVDEAIKRPQQLLEQALEAPVLAGVGGAGVGAQADSAHAVAGAGTAGGMSIRAVGHNTYQALMNGVSYMIPFVVTGGLLLAFALSLGGEPTAQGLVVPEGSFWSTIEQLGVLAFSLMVPVLSAYISVGIADRPGLAPGFITGMVAVTGSLYDSEAGTGFIGGIIAGVLSGYVALGIRKIPVNKFIAPIMPIIIIPIFTTLIVGLLFIFVIGHPVAALFESLTQALKTLDGGSVVILGAVLGAMIAFDMGGPFNKTAFLFGGGLIAAGNPHPMGMVAAAISVPPLALGLATFIRRQWFNESERNAGTAALLMGFFGLTEGAIPLAAARPLQAIPANVLGGAVAGAVAGVLGVGDNVMHGGPIVAMVGAVDGVVQFFLALAAGVATTAAVMLVGIAFSRGKEDKENKEQDERLLREQTVLLDLEESDRDGVLRALIDASADRVRDKNQVLSAAVEREAKFSTAVGDGVAIPHAKTAAVTHPVLAVARLREPIDWVAPDGKPVNLVFFIAVPDSAAKQHLKILAKLAAALTKTDFRERVLAAQSAGDVVACVSGVTSVERAAHTSESV